jgi:catechol 2,3-dioxygenase-like lactoylglutathione lyase family enzyme/ribosome-associated toxin RatA of RatAB toxin-antitoxin module
MSKVISTDSVLLDFPAEYVYRTLTDFTSYSHWWPKAIKFRIVHLNPGITGTTLDVQNGPFVKWKSEITSFKTNRLLAIDYVSGAWVGKTNWRFEDKDGKTELTLDINLEVNKRWLNVVSVFINFSKFHSHQIKQVFESLRKYLSENEGAYMHKIRLSHLDHIVLTVTDAERTCTFYHNNLGMEIVTFGDGRKALKFGDQKINLHEVEGGFNPRAANPTIGSGDICLVSLTDVMVAADYLKQKGIEIIAGPVERIGTHGKLKSIYLRDPDGNLIELSNYVR